MELNDEDVDYVMKHYKKNLSGDCTSTGVIHPLVLNRPANAVGGISRYGDKFRAYIARNGIRYDKTFESLEAAESFLTEIEKNYQKTIEKPLNQNANGEFILIGSKGEQILVDEDTAKKFRNCHIALSASGYPCLQWENKQQQLHRVVMNAKLGTTVDHVNRIKTDVRRANLRFTTAAINGYNKTKWGTTSIYKNVLYDKERKKYRVEITKDGKNHYGGRFINEIDAAKGANVLAKKLYGADAILNQVGM